MLRVWFLAFVTFCLFKSNSATVTVGSFDQIGDGLHDAWNELDPAFLNGRKVALYGNGKLYLVGSRKHRVQLEDPWDSAVRGGVVSSFDVTSRVWTHTKFDRVDNDGLGDVLFVLDSRLHMLIYDSRSQSQYSLRLMVWSGQEWTPAEETARFPSPSFDKRIKSIRVSTPDVELTTAYVMTGSHGFVAESDNTVLRLDVQSQAGNRSTATLTNVFGLRSNRADALTFTAEVNQTLYAFSQSFLSEGYVWNDTALVTFDLSTSNMGRVALSGDKPSFVTHGSVFQLGDQVLVVGGQQTVTLTQVKVNADIWCLDLSTLSWSKVGTQFPQGHLIALDQHQRKIYAVSVDDGVKQAQVSL